MKQAYPGIHLDAVDSRDGEMNILIHYAFLLIIPCVVLLHLFAAPYTKVEESFNVQAIHDILRYGIPLKDSASQLALKFDHATFSGAVPRTFIGALSLAELARPLSGLVRDGLATQMLVRAILGLLNAAALLHFYGAVRQAFGNVAGYWYILFQASQFHVMFYASRTLPNMFAFTFSTLALRSYIMSSFGSRKRRAKRHRLAIYLLTVAGVIFRSELAILVGTVSIALLSQKASISRTIIPAGLVAAAIGLTTTVTTDSFFWQQSFLWPEWSAFYFNTIQGKSSDWGTSPWHFYFSSAVPRLMLNPFALLACIPVALFTHQTSSFSVRVLSPLLAFVGVFSILPHKEWRFIIYIIPGLTAVAAAGASTIWARRSRSFANQLIAVMLLGSVVVSFVASLAMLSLSALNYPGAFALERLHAIADGSKPVISVHLDNLACQTGVTRFLQLPSIVAETEGRSKSVWAYDKTDASEAILSMGPLFYDRFDYLLVEKVSDEIGLLGNWDTVDTVMGFGGIGFVKTGGAEEAVLAGHGNALDLVAALWKSGENWLKKNVTGGRWLAIKMVPKIKILRNSMRAAM